MRWLIDASNVIGARPDGWWRDRAGAARRLNGVLRGFSDDTGEEVVLVLDGSVPGLPEGTSDGLTIVASPTRRPNAADDEIVRLVGEEPVPGRLRVVTSDATLAERVKRLGASVEGAGTFRRRIRA